MDPHSFTNSDEISGPPKEGPFWDPLGEYEYHDTKYTLLVYTPPRPPPRWLPKFLTEEPVVASRRHVIRPAQDKPNYDCFELKDLDDLKVKMVKIKSHDFPPEMRCRHVLEGGEKKCEYGCYVLEKGGSVRRWRCKRSDCEGHVYVGNVKTDRDEIACFGKKGERLVCIEE